MTIRLSTVYCYNPHRIRISDGAKKMPTVDTSGRFKTKNKKHDTKIIKI